MPVISITNQVASQALRGQNVKITVDLSTQSAEFAQLQVGQLCENVNGGADGYIYSIDTYGNSFEVAPIAPNFSMQNGSDPGYFSQGTDLDVTV
jgi:hypothetical protein